MIHRLSLLWGKSVERIEDEYTAEDIIRYSCLYELEPWGCEADDLRSQQLAFLIAQANSKKKLNPADFAMPWRKPVRRKVPFEVGMMLHRTNIDGKHRT
jgi:hypothetical protein